MPVPPAIQPFHDGLANQQKLLPDSIRPLDLEQMQLRPAPGEWAIWQLCANMAGGRLYWLCQMLGEPDLGLARMFRVDHATVPGIDLQWAGWEDNEDQPRTAAEITAAFEKTWQVVEACTGRWTLDDLSQPVTATDAWGQQRTITPAGSSPAFTPTKSTTAPRSRSSSGSTTSPPPSTANHQRTGHPKPRRDPAPAAPTNAGRPGAPHSHQPPTPRRTGHRALCTGPGHSDFLP